MNDSLPRLCRFAGLIMMLGSVCCCSTGCQDMTGAAMEKAIDVTSEDSPKRASFAAKFRKLKEDCPMEINDYTTLQYVKMRGVNRIEYRYQVSESGRGIVTMDNWRQLDPEILKRTAEGPLANSVLAMDLSIDHVYKDTDGLQMYSKRITKLDLKKAKQKAELAEKRKQAEEKMAELAAKHPKPAPTTTGKGITITTLEEHSRSNIPKVSNPVFSTGDAFEQVEASDVSTKRADWIPEKFNGFHDGQKSPAGVQSNPYGSAPAQANPYAQ